MFLRVDDDGLVWGGSTFGQTLFSLDPRTRKYSNTRTVSDHGGEVYDAAFHKGIVYAVAYAGGEIIRYDPHEPWDQINHKNPRTIFNLGEKGYIRPIGLIQLGPDGKLYSGWQAKYGTYGGAVAITDPDTEKTEMIENPLGEQAVASVAVGNGKIFIGTNLAANGLPPKQGEWARFGVMDASSKKMLFEHTFEGAGTVWIMGYDAVSKKAVVSTGNMWLFDSVTNKFTQIDHPLPNSGSIGMLDGKLYYRCENSIVELDIRKNTSSVLFAGPQDAPQRIRNVAVDSKGTIYYSVGADVFALRSK